MFKNVASQKLIVYVFDSTTNLPKTGDAGNLTAYVSKDYGSVTVLGDTSATEMDSTNARGYYLFDLTQGETNADTLLFSCKSATSNMVALAMPATVFTRPPNFSSQAITSGGIVQADLQTVKTQAVTCAAGVTVLASVGTAATSTAQTGDTYALANGGSGFVAIAGYLDTEVAAIKAKTDLLPTWPANFANLVITAAGTVDCNLHYILGSGLLEGDDGRLATAFSYFLDVATPVFTVASVNQTADGDIKSVNQIEVTGSGTSGDPWGPV